MSAVREVVTGVLASAILAISGCSSSGKSGGGGSAGPTTADDLVDVAGLLRDHTLQFKRGPSRLADVSNNQQLYPRGYAAIQNGTIVVLWGVPMPAEGGRAAVIAYEKKVETEDGAVLLENGEIKKMTPDEFRSAPKAN
jgi:hypothetical protein